MKMSIKGPRLGIRAASLGIVTSAILAFAVCSQDMNTQRQQSNTNSTPMMGMMRGCRQQCGASLSQCSQMMSQLREARDSNDPAKMRAAIDQALRTCNRLQENMSNCSTNMTRLQRMRGGMMMNHGGMMKGTQQKQGP